jgi:hypothetical protein
MTAAHDSLVVRVRKKATCDAAGHTQVSIFIYPQVTPSHVVIVLTNRTLTTKLASAVRVNKGCERTPLSGCDTAFLLYSETYF